MPNGRSPFQSLLRNYIASLNSPSRPNGQQSERPMERKFQPRLGPWTPHNFSLEIGLYARGWTQYNDGDHERIVEFWPHGERVYCGYRRINREAAP